MKVCVIGGGASGMMCATMIARKGHDVCLFEKNEKLGKKLYITGKGRCNVTNACTGSEFLSKVVRGKKFVMGAVTRFDSNDTCNFFKELHIPLKIERGNRVFPESDKASDIIKGLERAMAAAGVKVFLNSKVEALLAEGGKINGIVLGGKKQFFDAVVVATGGLSYSSTGSTGDGYTFAKQLGHTIIETVPGLCAVKIAGTELKELEGLSLKNVRVIAKENDKTIYESEIGEMLFTADGISGPIVLSMSSYINRCNLSDVKIIIDFKPALSPETLSARIDRDIMGLGAKQFSSLLEGLLPKSLCRIFAKRLGIAISTKANQLSRENRKNLSFLLKNYIILPVSLENFNSAVITSGGVNTKEINPKNMKSKLIDGLYFIGEVLDIDALTGGFNIQLAFSTAVSCACDFD